MHFLQFILLVITYLGFTFALPTTTNTTTNTTNLTLAPLSYNDISTLSAADLPPSFFTAPNCIPQHVKPNKCTLGTQQWQSLPNMMLFIYNSACRLIGFQPNAPIGMGGTYGLTSELPWVMIVTATNDVLNPPCFKYAGQEGCAGPQFNYNCVEQNGGVYCRQLFNC